MDFDTGLKLLREGIRNSAATQLWSKNREIDYNCVLTGFDSTQGLFSVWRPGEYTHEAIKAALKRSGEQDCRFSVTLNQAVIFFRATYYGSDEVNDYYTLPTAYFKVQRRGHMRLPIPYGYVMKCTFVNPLDPLEELERKILDISGGGAAVLVSDDEAVLFSADTVLHQFRFVIRGKQLMCKAEVRHTKPVPDNSTKPGYRMGLRFLDLNAADTAFVDHYVNQEVKKYFIGL
jgi:hypothetical protein